MVGTPSCIDAICFRVNSRLVKRERPQPTDPDLIALGKAIKARRVDQNLSQEKLAARADLTTNYLSDVERGTRNLGVKALFAIARALDVHISALFESPPEI